MANIHLTYHDMTNAAQRLMSGHDELEHKLGELQSMIDNLVSEGYVTDQSSVAFQETFTEFTTGAKSTVAALQGLSRFLVAAARTMEETDSSLASQVRS